MLMERLRIEDTAQQLQLALEEGRRRAAARMYAGVGADLGG